MSFPCIHQLEANDCGPTCIQMITAHYGKKLPLKKLKEMSSLTRQGISALDIVECLRKTHFEAAAVSISKENLGKIPLPAILYWRQEHYVVLYDIQKQKEKSLYSIADPSFGAIKLSDEDFDKCWINGGTGVTIAMKPKQRFFELEITDEKPDNYMKRIMFLFHNIAKKYPRNISLTFALILISIVLNWAMPIILQKVIDEGVIQHNINIVWKLMLFQLLFFCGYSISDSLSSIILTKINFNESIKYLAKYLHKLINLPINFFDTRLNTDLIQRMEDHDKIQSFLTHRFIEVFFALLNTIVFGSILIYYSGVSFLVFFVLSALSVLWTLLFLKKRKRLDYDRFYVGSQSKNNIYEMINGMSEIKINNAQHVRISKWAKVQSKMNEISLRSLYLNYYQVIGSSFVNRLRDIIITCLCAYYIINDQMTLGVMMTISYILGQLSYPLSQLTQFSQVMQDASNSLQRLDDIQERESEDNDKKIVPPDLLNEGVKLSKVYFKYTENTTSYVIENLSLCIPKGKITAVVGVSGSGKTTLAKLLLSFYYPQEGQIFLDGIELNKINADLWRQKCGVVMQDGVIFSGTIAENIALCDEFPDINRVIKAAHLACIDQFVEKLPMKYRTKIGNVGVNLSGGEKQRILIARAIYKNPEFIIFDEATSSLDANNEMAILNNLNTFFIGKTVVVVAHRLSTVKNADNIIVMDKGRIVEQGTHAELSSLRGPYYNLVRNQLELGT